MKQKILSAIFLIIMCSILPISNNRVFAELLTDDEYTIQDEYDAQEDNIQDEYDTQNLYNEQYDYYDSYDYDQYINDGYNIQSYDINMVVNEDNTFDITENITAYFNVEKHGIYRKIPLRNTVIRNDGSETTNRAKISNISVSEKYTTNIKDGYKVIKIGDANSIYTGSHSYTIKYRYKIGKDPLKNADELYFNLIGTQWDTNINNVSFKITMPKSFDKSLLGFTRGSYGSTDNDGVNYSVNGNVITGTVENELESGEGVTVRLTLPEGYFSKASDNIPIYPIFVMILCVVFILIADRLWAKYGKDDKVIETVEFYPPDGCNSVELGFLYKGTANNKDVISLLIYLADKGYLKIEEIQKKSLFQNKKSFKITKLKEYTGNNEYEKEFFEGLFKCKKDKRNANKKSKKYLETEEESTEEEFVTSSDLYDKFYKTIDKIQEKINTKENRSKIFDETADGKRKYLIVMILIIVILITVKPFIGTGEYKNLLFCLMFFRNWIHWMDC